MNVEWQRVRTVFEQALDVDDSQRNRWLRNACGDDEALRAEVEELLLAASHSADVLVPPDAVEVYGDLERQLALPELSGRRVGGYELGPVLASGGMGVVFEARQVNPRRRVALKMLRLGIASADGARRFRYEAEMLARLRHPAIAQIYEAGVHGIAAEDGAARELPWFAMEFVEGASTLLDHSGAANLSIQQRIELFRAVCDAVHHGHQRGVVHRDLKPANILVDRAGRPKIIDFGVARATDRDSDRDAPRTRAGQIVGTLRYMSPEQLAGRSADVDARADVYALGVILFELLSGRLPYEIDGLPVHEMARVIREVPPRRLGELSRRLGGDLEVVAATALAKEPNRRYRSAAALSDDLGRCVRGEAITARPPSLGYQLRLFARRHRIVASAIVAVVVVSVGAALVATRAEWIAEGERRRATELFDTLLGMSSAFVFEFQDRMNELPGSTRLRSEMIAKALADLEQLEAGAGDDDRIRLAIARAYIRLARVQGDPSHSNTGELAAAAANVAHGREIAAQVLTREPGHRAARRAIADAESVLGAMAAEELRIDDAIARYQQAIGHYEELRGDDPLAHDFALARAWSGIGSLLARLNRHDEALEAYTACTAVTRRSHDAAPQDTARAGNHAGSHAKLGVTLMQQGKLAEARGHMEASLAIQEDLCRREPANLRHRFFRGKQHLVYGSLLLRENRLQESEAAMRAGLAAMQELSRADPETVSYIRDAAYAHNSLASVLMARARAAAEPAGDLWREAHNELQLGLSAIEAMIEDGRLARAMHERWLRVVRRSLRRCARELEKR